MTKVNTFTELERELLNDLESLLRQYQHDELHVEFCEETKRWYVTIEPSGVTGGDESLAQALLNTLTEMMEEDAEMAAEHRFNIYQDCEGPCTNNGYADFVCNKCLP